MSDLEDHDWRDLLLAPKTWRNGAAREAWRWARIATRHPDLGMVNQCRSVGEAWTVDPLHVAGKAWAEGRFLQEGFRRFSSDHEQSDEEFLHHRLFVQILRVKTHLFRHLLADGRFQGLENFTKVYDRMKPYRLELEHLGLELGARATSVNLQSVEVRTAPGGARDLLDLATMRVERTNEPISHAPSAGRAMEWGWTLHFLRSRTPWSEKNDGTWLTCVLSQANREVGTCVRVFEVFPQLLAVIRGIDVAMDELDGPMWTMLPAVRRLRDASERITADSGIGRPMRVTLHAGEDFSHPVTGLRHVHELLIWEVLHPQDRIGHAVALGIEPVTYQSRQVAQPRFERFLDLCWLLAHAERRQVWEEELDRLREAMKMRHGHPMHELIAIHARLGREGAMATTWEVGQRPSGTTALDDFLTRVVEAPAQEITCIDVSRDEVEAASRLQKHIAAALAAKHITIELNPSSNLMLAGFDIPLQQPLFARAHDLGLKVTISADDPLLLATCLDDEFAYAHAGLVRARTHPLTPVQATAWLEGAAEASMRARFTLPESSTLDDESAPLHWFRVWRRPERI